MQIALHSIPIRALVNGYQNSRDTGIIGYGGLLNIRPPYQREFRYDTQQKQAVIHTILHGFPLNTMYWSEADGGGYEMIDGQQRTLSICEFMQHEFHIALPNRSILYYDTLTDQEKEQFLSYELTVYFCQGTDREKLDWFRVINIAGAKLLDQELRNAVYAGPFVSDARRYFSKRSCPAYGMGGSYMAGNPLEQAYLETVLKWAARKEGVTIDDYMARHQHDPNANLLWGYYSQIITWVQTTFPHYRKEMKGLDWGAMFDEFGGKTLDTTQLEQRVHDLVEDDEIMKKGGIYRYVLSGDLRDLSFRTFDTRQKRQAYERQEGICPRCGKHFRLEEMEADHITPWVEGGTTVPENCQMLCKACNRLKGVR